MRVATPRNTAVGEARPRIYALLPYIGLFVVMALAIALTAIMTRRAETLWGAAAPILALAAGIAAGAGARARRLWRKHNESHAPSDVHQVNLAIALGSGAAVAVMIAILQVIVTAVADIQRVRAERKSDERRIAAQREDFRFRMALTRDLTGFSPPQDPEGAGRIDMSGYKLRGKVLALADLDKAKLSAADLTAADLEGATMTGAILNQSGDSRTQLRATTLRKADLRRAKLLGANLTEADLRGAHLFAAEFGDNKLDWADLRDVDCGQKSADPRPCSAADLEAIGLPSFDKRPPTACWPTDKATGARAECGKYARILKARSQAAGGAAPTSTPDQ